MNGMTRTFALASITAAALALPAAHASEALDRDIFVTVLDARKDEMVTKAEAMKQAEKMVGEQVEKFFEKQGAKNDGKVARSQLDRFLRELMNYGGA
ncbi:MAG TPA: hypothetical protein VFV55_08475 [Usitatibacteraceae bacterium]|nr:hypothetical protein [Usitatibacteraceae bacterium]